MAHESKNKVPCLGCVHFTPGLTVMMAKDSNEPKKLTPFHLVPPACSHTLDIVLPVNELGKIAVSKCSFVTKMKPDQVRVSIKIGAEYWWYEDRVNDIFIVRPANKDDIKPNTVPGDMKDPGLYWAYWDVENEKVRVLLKKHTKVL